MSNAGSFKKGITPWNKGKKGCFGANKGSFSRENLVRKFETGIPVNQGRHNGVICTIDERVPHRDTRTGNIYMHRRRTTYARYVLQQAGIEIPPNCVAYHKDGDFENNELENLEVITRGELARRNRSG